MCLLQHQDMFLNLTLENCARGGKKIWLWQNFLWVVLFQRRAYSKNMQQDKRQGKPLIIKPANTTGFERST